MDVKPNVKVWDDVAKEYSLLVNEEEINLAGEIDDLFNRIGCNRSGRILELGCGSGHLSSILCSKGYSTLLLDFSPVAIEKSKELFCREKLVGEFILEDLFAIDKNIECDIAWNSGVMEHFSENQLTNLLIKLRDIDCKYYVFIVPNPNSLLYLLFRYKIMSENKWTYGTEYLRNNYIDIFNICGFDIVFEDYLGMEFTKHFVKTAFPKENSIEWYSKMVDDKLISKDQAYLKAFVLKKNNKIQISDKQEDEDESAIITEHFDNSAKSYYVENGANKQIYKIHIWEKFIRSVQKHGLKKTLLIIIQKLKNAWRV